MNIKDYELLNFTALTQEQSAFVLQCRNSENVRRWMYNDRLIGKKEHEKFLQSLQEKAHDLYFLVKAEGEYKGVIYYNDIVKNESVKMGVYADPKQVGNGDLLMHILIEYALKTLQIKKIVAELFFDNTKAYALYKRFGFKEAATKYVNNKKVLIMEFEDENR